MPIANPKTKAATRREVALSLTVAAILGFSASAAWSCAGPSGQTQAAASWSVEEVDPDYNVAGLDGMVGETYFYEVARSPLYPGLEVPLVAYSIAGGQIYDWVTLARYDHKIGLSQYSAGAAGTSTTVEFINNVVVDLHNNSALGAANVMVTNQADFCEYSTWEWSDGGVRVEDEGNSTVVEFTFDFGATQPKRYLDD